ncbi:hypothetical protein CASFOL_032946 [Castilleja foliolosa]|uniref:Cycloidea-like protein n=1 Tax=Castilleja foliolosa TaxID=1961234 RepID=A0ABD3C5M2_9LAMI
MFNKNNTYLFPHDHPHHQPRSSPANLTGPELFLHHHPDMIFSGHHYTNNITTNITDLVKKPSKKDRHSKIYTSQGPRDRRVRLSIGIARKFFDLQEMLGFDKPSKTLDWLLTKSKAAIKELVQSTKEKTNANISECDEETSKGKTGNKNTKEKASSSTSLAKESRAKARARARERTREKMQLKNGLINGPVQYTNVENYHQDLIQEPVKRKTKNNMVPSFFGFHQNVFVSRDSGSSYGAGPFASVNGAPENWDVCNITSQSNMFMNSSSNM